MTALTSVNSSISTPPPSCPSPERLIPPTGGLGITEQPLTPTGPLRMAFATRSARQVGGADSAREAIIAVVGDADLLRLILERDDAQHGTGVLHGEAGARAGFAMERLTPQYRRERLTP